MPGIRLAIQWKVKKQKDHLSLEIAIPLTIEAKNSKLQMSQFCNAFSIFVMTL
jgi:hypothetical protein